MSVGRALRIDSQADAPTNVENGGRNDRKPRRHLGEDLEMFCKRVTEADTDARTDGRFSFVRIVVFAVRVVFGTEDVSSSVRNDTFGNQACALRDQPRPPVQEWMFNQWVSRRAGALLGKEGLRFTLRTLTGPLVSPFEATRMEEPKGSVKFRFLRAVTCRGPLVGL